MCVCTWATGIERSQNGSNTVDLKPQTVQVRELFSCPTNKSENQTENLSKIMQIFGFYINIQNKLSSLMLLKGTHPQLCCPLAPSTDSTSAWLFPRPCQRKAAGLLPNLQTDSLFKSHYHQWDVWGTSPVIGYLLDTGKKSRWAKVPTHERWSKSSTDAFGGSVALFTSLWRPSNKKRRNSWASCWLQRDRFTCWSDSNVPN